MRLDQCTHGDYLQILENLEDFWGSDRARQVHHPMFVHEFGDTAWVVREDRRVIACLFAFWSQTGPTGYIHLVGVRRSYQRRGIGRWLYEHFEAQARERGCTRIKAITPPSTETRLPSIATSASPSLGIQPMRTFRLSKTTSDRECLESCLRSGSTDGVC